MLVAAASERALPDGLPEGLVAQILDGKVLRADRIEECRRRLVEGPPTDVGDIVDAMVRELARGSHPALS